MDARVLTSVLIAQVWLPEDGNLLLDLTLSQNETCGTSERGMNEMFGC